MRSLAVIICFCTVFLLTGCEDFNFEPQQRDVNPGAFGVTIDTADTAGRPDPTPPRETQEETQRPSQEGNRTRPPQSGQRPPQSGQRPSQYNSQVADVGVGRRGRNYGGGIYTQPVSTYFASQEQMAFRIQVPQALSLYKATNGNGPRTHDEFMEKIIKANRISLPDLPEGDEYFYDAKEEKLMVHSPRR